MQQQQHPCCLNSHIFLSSQQTIKRFSTLGWSCVRFEGSLGRSRLFLSRLVPLKEDKLHRSGPSTWWMLNSLFPLTHVSCMIQTVTLPFTTHSVTLLAALICSCSWYFVHPCWLQVACVVASWRDAVVKRLRCVSRTVGHYSPPPFPETLQDTNKQTETKWRSRRWRNKNIQTGAEPSMSVKVRHISALTSLSWRSDKEKMMSNYS